MGLTHFPNGISTFGYPVVPPVPFMSDSAYYYVDAVNGNDGNSGTDPSQAIQSIAKGYSLLRAGHYDTLFVIGLGTAFTLSAPLLWTKDYTNLVGITAPIAVGKRARITNGIAVISPLIDFSGTGITVKNLQIAQFGGDATLSALNVVVEGQRCYFEGVHFSGGNNATVRAGTLMRSLSIIGTGGNGENVFDNCFIGNDVQGSAGANYELDFATFAPRNLFRQCTFYKLVISGGAGGGFINFPAGSLDRWTTFENCNFINPIGVAGYTVLTTAFNVAAADGVILMRDPIVVGATGMTGGSKANFKINSIIAAATGGLATTTTS